MRLNRVQSRQDTLADRECSKHQRKSTFHFINGSAKNLTLMTTSYCPNWPNSRTRSAIVSKTTDLICEDEKKWKKKLK